jgi:Asp-tRNA(Asn)/Glu-tRNA(Gln) amidotransferase A subunit family amidase
MTTTSTSAATDPWRLSVTELAAAIRHRQVSVREVIDAHLRRIDAVNPAVNAIVIRLDEQALDEAGRADQTTIADGELPPFHGAPFTIKESIDVAGTPTTQGAQALIFPMAPASALTRNTLPHSSRRAVRRGHLHGSSGRDRAVVAATGPEERWSL